MKTLLLFFLLIFGRSAPCLHHEMSKHSPNAIVDDTAPHRPGRLLQTTNSSCNVGNLRIFADYSLINSTSVSSANLIKRMVNITAIYFYNILTVQRLNWLSYPSNQNTNCSGVVIPQKYVTEGVQDADLGIVVANERNNTKATYIAKSVSCAYLKSNKRPVWGVMVWNDLNLKYDPEGFQELLFVAAHELTHVLGFSALLYDLYVGGTPLVQTEEGNYLNTSKINKEVAEHFGCQENQGMLLEDEDGTLIASHWERKAVGTEYMTATNVKSPYMSRFTLALLESTGWYPSVNYDYAQPSQWGKGKGCGMLNFEDCSAVPEYCQKNGQFSCDFDGTGVGGCKNDSLSNCKFSKYFTNTMCIDPNFPAKNLNRKMQAQEYGGYDSRCFQSDFRKPGLNATTLNFRCYKVLCSKDHKKLYIRINNSVLTCHRPSQVLQAPAGLSGTLTCPSSFEQYCRSKRPCQSHCNINGICVNGQCLCTGNRQLQPTCLDVKLTVQQMGSTGGFLNAIENQISSLSSSKQNQCFPGFVLQKQYGECMPCSDYFNCSVCNELGCLFCDDGGQPFFDGRCPKT